MNLLIHPSPRAQRGLSLVELMVAMTISLIGMIVIFQVFEVSQGIKRTTTSGGDAQQNGAIALYSMDRDVRNAGMGFNDVAQAGCNIIGYDNTRVPTDFPVAGASLLLVPVRIVPGPNSRTPDTLVVMYGSQTHSASATTINTTMGVSTDPVRVTSTYGFRPGDLILLRQTGTANPCSIMEVTQVIGDELRHQSGSYTLGAGGAQVTARFNKPTGLGVLYTTAPVTNVYNLGNLYDTGGMTLPVHTTWSISNNALTTTAVFVVSPPSTIADNIVHMRALYGLDDGVDNGTVTYSTLFNAGDGLVDRWVDGNTVPDWRYVIAVRLVVVARSAQPEIPAAGRGAPCDTTPAEPTWSGSNPAAAPNNWAGPPWNFNTRLDLSTPADTPTNNWQCYRYKTFETTVPVRNWIWKAS
jgi:type IV pilus assembly protein PilW